MRRSRNRRQRVRPRIRLATRVRQPARRITQDYLLRLTRDFFAYARRLRFNMCFEAAERCILHHIFGVRAIVFPV
jgi:hypothetical protein